MTIEKIPPIGLNIVSNTTYDNDKKKAHVFLDAVESGTFDFRSASKETLEKIKQAELLTGRFIKL